MKSWTVQLVYDRFHFWVIERVILLFLFNFCRCFCLATSLWKELGHEKPDSPDQGRQYNECDQTDVEIGQGTGLKTQKFVNSLHALWRRKQTLVIVTVADDQILESHVRRRDLLELQNRKVTYLNHCQSLNYNQLPWWNAETKNRQHDG